MSQRANRTAAYLSVTILTAGTLALAIRGGRTYAVEGDSMRPTLAPKDYVHVWAWPWPLPLPHGALVVATRPDRPTLSVIKRVHGIERDGSVRLYGDNPGASTDSRHFGPVPRARLEGLAWLRYWPLQRFGLLIPLRPRRRGLRLRRERAGAGRTTPPPPRESP